MDPKELAYFRHSLKDWGRNHFRAFPWRSTNDPYMILMAELMLHRTKASQVVRVYERVLARYPDIKSLAHAENMELHRLLFPLGLHWRTNLIPDMAREILHRFGGNIPQHKTDLLSLAGISEYIASSVRCFAWNITEPLLDTNTVRVVARLLNLKARDSSRRNSQFKDIVSQLVDPIEPRVYNYALLDLADEVCTKRSVPKCRVCPVSEFCLSRSSYEKLLISGVVRE